MPNRSRRSFLAVATVVFLTVFCLAPLAAGQGSPNTAALSAFAALHAAESSGANITSLVNEYNALMEESAPNSSFIALQQLAQSAQQNAISHGSFEQTLTLILVPTIALALALASEGLLQLRRKIKRERMLEMEIERK
jgi:hypothetical protein